MLKCFLAALTGDTTASIFNLALIYPIAIFCAIFICLTFANIYTIFLLMDIVIIGSGNVATVMGRKMALPGTGWCRWLVVTPTRASALANLLGSPHYSWIFHN